MLVRAACVRTRSTGTPVVVETQTEMAVVWKHHWMKTKNLSQRSAST
jgi:hypothetical protein